MLRTRVKVKGPCSIDPLYSIPFVQSPVYHLLNHHFYLLSAINYGYNLFTFLTEMQLKGESDTISDFPQIRFSLVMVMFSASLHGESSRKRSRKRIIFEFQSGFGVCRFKLKMFLKTFWLEVCQTHNCGSKHLPQVTDNTNFSSTLM